MKKAIYIFLTVVCVCLTGIVVFADHIVDTKANDTVEHQWYYNHEETQRNIIPEDIKENTAKAMVVSADLPDGATAVKAMTLSETAAIEGKTEVEEETAAIEEPLVTEEPTESEETVEAFEAAAIEDEAFMEADEEVFEEPSLSLPAYIEPIVRTVEVDTDPMSITTIVNHMYVLSEDFVPDDMVYAEVFFNCVAGDEKRMMRKEAAEELKKMFDAAKEKGLKLCAMSGYRSYERQNRLHLNNVRLYGEEYADCYSAKAGESEHQLGLAMDISSLSNNYSLDYNFSSTAEGQWLAENACEFGFIIRYPKDKEDVTGFAFEPWHFRYVGKQLAEYLTMNELTLDEYYGISAETDTQQN